MKQIAKWILALVILALCLPLTVFAEEEASAPRTLVAEADAASSGSCGENLTWKFSADTGTLTVSGTGPMEDFSKGGSPWYDLRADIKTVVLKDGVTTTGNYAFFALRNLTKVTFPDTLTGIGDNTFYLCKKLTSVSIPASVTEIGTYAFYDCESLKKLVLPEGLTAVPDNLCAGCCSLTSVTIPGTVKTIGDGAFAYCDLKTVTIPDGVTVIGVSAFTGCSSLETVVIPDSVTELGWDAFRECTALKSVKLSSRLTVIESDLFLGCTALTEITIPEGVEKISTGAFWKCTALKSVVIPSTLKTADRSCFTHCSKLTDFYISDLEAWLNVYIPPKDPEDDEPYYTLLRANHREKNLYLNGKLLTELVIPEGTTAIRDEAFYYCTCIKSITIPDSVTQIGNSAFWCCEPEEIRITDLSAWMQWSLNDWIMTGSTKLFLNGKELTDLVIPADITVIKRYAFYGCASLRSVTLHDQVQQIDDYAFEYCKNLGRVSFGDGISEIGVAAFSDCDALKEIEIPDSVTLIDSSAFLNCTGLTRVKLGNGIDTLNYSVFRECTNLKNLTIPDSVKTIEGCAMQDCSQLQNLVLPDSITHIYYLAFDGCDNLCDVFYAGTDQQKAAIRFSDGNDPLTDATWRCNSRITLEAPAVTLSRSASSGKPVLRWDAVSGADRYRVYRASSGKGSYKLLKTVTSTGYTDKDTKVGSTYYYKVMAVGGDGTSVFSEIDSQACTLRAPKVKLKVQTSSGKPKITWEKVSGAEKYYIVRATSKNGKYTKVATTSSTSYVDKNTKAGKTYYYKVKALHKKDAGDSGYSEVTSRVCDLKKPVITVTLSKGDPRIKWGKISGAEKYRVYRATSKDGTYKLVKTTKTATSYTDKNVKAGRTYYYKVIAIHANAEANSAYSSVKSIKAK